MAWPPLPVWRRLDFIVFLVAAYTALVVFMIAQFGIGLPRWLGDLGVVNGIVLGTLLSFRNHEAYDRWWEARKLWGQLINDSRNLCIKGNDLLGTAATPAERRYYGRLVLGFCVALKNHLRGLDDLSRVPGFEDAPERPTHVPAFFAQRIYTVIRSWQSEGRISEFDRLIIDPHGKSLMDICGACERIKSSPVPASYRALLRHGTILYLLTAPWFLPADYGYWSVGVVSLLGYFLVGIELTAEDVEEPFGKDGDDLDLSRFCEIIRATTEQIMNVSLEVSNVGVTMMIAVPPWEASAKPS